MKHLYSLLDANQAFALNGRGTTNHCPMALHALYEMGASPQQLQQFFTHWQNTRALPAGTANRGEEDERRFVQLRQQLANRLAEEGWLPTFEALLAEGLAKAEKRYHAQAAAAGIDPADFAMTDLRIHDLRRTLGSWQAKTGASLAIIGKSLNHKTHQATAIYARLDLDPVRQSVNTATAAMLEAAGLKEGAVLVGMMAPYANTTFPQMAAKKVSGFAMELLPRTTRAQSMDVLSSQNNIAGYKAVLLATHYYPRFMPMLMTAAGTVKPARVLIMGVGVAGLQAIATAKRLGAVVEATDVRASTKEQVESLGGKFIEVPMTDEEKAANDGVYAKEMSDDYKRRQAELVAKHARAADIIITTALIPGRPAPRLIAADVVAEMKPGSVIIDIAAEAGGNCELTRAGEVYTTDNGVTVVGLPNLPGMVAFDASSLYAKNLLTFLGLMLTKEGFKLNLEDDLLAATLVTHEGQVRFPAAQ